MTNRNDDPLYIDTHAMLASNAGFEASAIAMDLITFIWWPTKQPFEFNAASLSAYLAEKLPNRGYNETILVRNLEEIKSFFTVLPNGKWAPSPMYFSLSNGNPGNAS